MKIFWIFFLATVATVRGQFDPHYVAGRSVMVFLMDWKYEDVALECERFLGPMGFAGVQVSAASENDIVTSPLRPWWERYQVVSYKIGSRSGDADSFADMCTRCNNVGVRVYVDAIFNNMGGMGIMNGTAGSLGDSITRTFPAVPYTILNFHNPPCSITDYNNTQQVRNCDLVGAPDLDQSQPYVRDRIVGYLNHLTSLGCAGFRIDSAKHMWPTDLQAIYSSVIDLNTAQGFPAGSRSFIFQEVIDSGNEAIKKTDYSGIGDVTEFLYSYYLTDIFKGNQPLSTLSTWGQSNWGFLPSDRALVFVENHDNERGQYESAALNYKDGKPYVMAVAFALAHPFGNLRIMSDFDWTTYDQGPPMDANQDIISPTINADGSCGSGWVCQHRWRQIYGMVGFRNTADTADVTNFWSNGNNQIGFARQGRAFVAFNNNDADMNQTLQTTLPAGTYCDVITGVAENGACTGRTIVVANDGTANFVILTSDADGVIAIHVDQKL
ncbi:alpha-amylase 1-like [Lutzomyia longipalpis]|uniref:alpha-amylase 1-like n=1 Tax=Lutzomyia longipalpis TaxID=7200 RepID=UPI002483997E|nr:alpha-amylase 1-like [Lutzomyia longipalpis]